MKGHTPAEIGLRGNENARMKSAFADTVFTAPVAEYALQFMDADARDIMYAHDQGSTKWQAFLANAGNHGFGHVQLLRQGLVAGNTEAMRQRIEQAIGVVVVKHHLRHIIQKGIR